MPDKFYTPISIPRLPNPTEPADAGFVKLFATPDPKTPKPRVWYVKIFV